jgi:poly(3-hydroxybutyrate) depolymerase
MTTTMLRPAIGRDALEYRDALHPERSLVIHTYRPGAHAPDDPVVLVQHGIRRNGDEYRDFWIDAAEKHRLLVVATTFGNGAFPQPENYNNGSVVASDGTIRPREGWLYAILPRVVEALRAGGVTCRAQARLFGHSAGGQFVHRLMATQDHAIYEAVSCGNPGWYTLPTLDRPFPEGLGGLGLDESDLARWLAYPMTILAGDRDVDVADENLPRNPEALAQGPTRFARAHYFHECGLKEARRLGVKCNWKLVTIPGVGHDGCAMGKAAAAIWFEGRVPPAEELISESKNVV